MSETPTAEKDACPGRGDPIPDRYEDKGVCGNCFGTTDDPWHQSAGSEAPIPDVEKGLRRGWFADWDDEATSAYGWQPCLETGVGHIPCFEVWFKNKAECEKWIAANVVGVGWFPDDPTEIRVLPPASGREATP